jgi:hypothetical protein
MTQHGWTGHLRTALVVALALGTVGAVVRAAGTKKFYQQQQALRSQLRADQEREGLSGREHEKALYAKYPTPEITLCKPVIVAPGGTATVSLSGKFAEKTTFLVANDHVEIADGALAAGKYTAKVTAAADAGPAYAPIHAIAPVSGANDSCGALVVGAVATYDFKADNGWTIKATPQAKTFTVGSGEAKLDYLVSIFKTGETVAFKKMTSTLTIRENEDAGREIYLSLTTAAAEGSAQAELTALQMKLSDPQAFMKLSSKERDRLMTRLSELTELQMKELTAPDAAQKAQQEQDNSCNSLVFSLTGGAATGSASCGRNIGGGRLKFTGTMTLGAAS